MKGAGCVHFIVPAADWINDTSMCAVCTYPRARYSVYTFLLCQVHGVAAIVHVVAAVLLTHFQAGNVQMKSSCVTLVQ